ncbi:MAG: UDP-N-acetylmuramate dehydrogenase [Actinomycetia bacterium]|nr:UDP-N-acetylmuramate dehydrogenase [Actinomycetes bacterium]
MAELTTLGVGGPPDDLVIADNTEHLVAEVAAADQAADPLLLLGGGSNVLVGDAGWPGRALLIRSRGVNWADSDAITVAAGENWSDFVDTAVSAGLSGIEALAGIPGLVGATPIQNVGAYGQEVASVIRSVHVYDRLTQQPQQLTSAECRFGYRTSLFKDTPGRFVVLDVTFALRQTSRSQPIAYAELAKALSVSQGETAPLGATRNAVLALRRRKGMVLDANDADSRSAGSFFTNPILSPKAAEQLPPEAPQYPGTTGVKTSAAWLIENAGFTKGYRNGNAQLSTKHTLAITNPGAASAAEVLQLADEIRQAVDKKFGIVLEPEPVLVNCSLS